MKLSPRSFGGPSESVASVPLPDLSAPLVWARGNDGWTAREMIAI
jgi:hypothetical protein